VSTAIKSFDGGTRVGVTASGQRYLLSGWPCFDGDVVRIWKRFAEQYGISETKDVSVEYMGPRNL